MAQHNQLHQMAGLPLSLQGLNFTILNQQHPQLGQIGQPTHQGMYQIIGQVQPGQHQVQLQNVQHQFNNQFQQIQHQQFNQHQHILVQSQNQQQINQQLQNQQQQQQQHQIQQQQQQHQIQQQQQQHHQQQQLQQQQQQQQAQQQQTPQKDNNSTVQLTKTGKKKRAKHNKDGVPAPKRATTAYINFTQYYRENMKKQGRTVPKIGEFGKECAGKWNSMNEEEKKPFTDEAERDRERYRREMDIFKPQRDANKPKRPGTAFMLFMVDFRKEVAGKEPEGGVAALAKLGGERWRGMTDEDKKPYVEQQNEAKIIYEQKMEVYRKLTGLPPGKTTNNSSKVTPVSVNSVKSEDSDTNEHLNNSLSNSNISNNNGNSVDQLNKLNNHDEQSSHNHNSQSPGSTSSPHQAAVQAMSPSESSLPSIATTIPLQQPFYTTTNSYMTTSFLDQQHEDASYSQSIDQQIDQQQLHDGQQTEQNDQQAYLQQNGQQAYHQYWG